MGAASASGPRRAAPRDGVPDGSSAAAAARGTLIELRSIDFSKSKTGSASASFELSSYDGGAASAASGPEATSETAALDECAEIAESDTSIPEQRYGSTVTAGGTPELPADRCGI